MSGVRAVGKDDEGGGVALEDCAFCDIQPERKWSGRNFWVRCGRCGVSSCAVGEEGEVAKIWNQMMLCSMVGRMKGV